MCYHLLNQIPAPGHIAVYYVQQYFCEYGITGSPVIFFWRRGGLQKNLASLPPGQSRRAHPDGTGVGESRWPEQHTIIQGLELVHPNIYAICELLEHI